jgi:hypothetical protein
MHDATRRALAHRLELYSPKLIDEGPGGSILLIPQYPSSPIRRGDGGPQKPFSSFSEGVRGVFTISTESSERTCVPHFSSSVTPHVLVVGGAGGYSLGTSSHNVWKTVVL